MLNGPIRFTNALGGTSDFIYPGPVIDMQSPTAAGAGNGVTYTYYAQSFDMTQWEIGRGAYTSSSGTFARTTVLANSLGTTAKINFGDPPQIFVFDSSSAGGAVREVLTAGRDYYVRSDGNDSNTGLANTAAGAFLTLQAAVNACTRIDVNGYNVNINITVAGSYAGATLKNVVGSPGGPSTLNIIGDINTPSNIVITSTLVLDSITSPWTIDGMLLNAPGSYLISCNRGSTIFIGRVELGVAVVQLGNSGGTVSALGYPITISGSASVCLYSEAGKNYETFAVTFKGCPGFGVFCVANYMTMTFVHGSTFTYPNATFDATTDRVTVPDHGRAANDPVAFTTTGAMPAPLVSLTTYFVKTVIDANTFTLSATAGGALIDLTTNGSSCKAQPTGQRYSVANNSTLFTNGGGANFLPGNTAGSAAPDSLYS